MMRFLGSRLLLIAGLACGVLTCTWSAQAQPMPTRVVVRAVSNDAKLLQDPVGGAQITIRNAETGQVLARGTQRGNSGSTEQIMRQPEARGDTLYATDGAAKYETTLVLRRPTQVVVEAEGPLAYPQALQRAEKTVLLVPGKDIDGDGITLTLHGFIVEVLAPETYASDDDSVEVRARVRMLCGCPTEPGGLWNAERYTIRTQLVTADGAILNEAPLTFTGTTSEYAGTLAVPDAEPSTLRVRVLATDAARVNFGMDEAEVPLTAPQP